ncbi:MAG: asparagine synthase (glutamine-hydrolyzing) [Magnetovibrionaceae bacterium]
MCGIVALFAYGAAAPEPDRAEALRIRDRMRARGPDGAGFWPDESEPSPVLLGHRRLAILDLDERSNQPFTSACGRYVLTYNGEIYNFRALRKTLEAKGVSFRTTSDTEVLVELFAREGRDMAARLRGMFAAAIWDREDRRLTLLRDGFGIKPLYLADDGQTLRVASSVKALLAGGGIDDAPDPAGHAGFFILGHVPEPHTLFQSIKSLPAGSWLEVEAGGRRREGRYFDASRLLAETENQPVDGIDFAGLLRESLSDHGVADVPVGLFLSAGRDSTTLAALASEDRNEALKTFTLGFTEYRGSDRDEVPLAEAVARALGTDHETRMVAGESFHRDWESLTADMDQPSIDGANVWLVAREARQTGLKVALSGLGADEILGGYDTFQRAPNLVSKWGWASGFGPLARRLSAPWLGRLVHPKAAGLIEQARDLPSAWLLRRALFMPWELNRVLDPDMARAGRADLCLDDRLAEAVQGISAPKRQVAALEMRFYMQGQLLRDADWAGMAHSLEIRVPFVDTHLFMALAPALLNEGGPTKQSLTEAPKRALPEAILNRPKSGFYVPLDRWLTGSASDPAEPGLRGYARQIHKSFS